MTRRIRFAIVTMLLGMLVITGSWREALGQDSSDLERQVRQLHEALCKVLLAQGLSILSTCPPLIQSRTIFLSGAQYNANLGGLGGADQKCQDLADSSLQVTGTYKAWLSDSRTHARDRLTHHPGPYKLPTGTVVAMSWDDLVDGTLMNAIKVTQGGVTPTGATVWTATAPDGTLSPTASTCGDWTQNTGTGGGTGGGNTGLFHFTDSNWTQASGALCSERMRLYCIQQ